ncbi:MAG: hypothetical protein J6Q15_00950 [Clostridia bacterium]|nr:hypothetical protein [Clostridia bacterium]
MRNKIKGQIKNYMRYKVLPQCKGGFTFHAIIIHDDVGTTLTKQDLESIRLLESQTEVNPSLMDDCEDFDDGGNIYSLMVEGVLPGQLTGADLGLYDYEPIIENKTKILRDEEKSKSGDIKKAVTGKFDIYYDDIVDYSFSHCILAEGNPLGGEETQIIRTFKGYLEVTTSDFSIIRKCDRGNLPVMIVYISNYYIRKYQLRNGDEISCVYQEQEGKMYVSSLLAINGYPYQQWNCNRSWFKDLRVNTTIQKLHNVGDYTEAIVKRFGLYKGDNVFLYINRNTHKAQLLPQFIEELSKMFDKVIYINPQYRGLNCDSYPYNVLRFCTPADAKLDYRITVALLGANHAKRLIELGQNVAVLIDDIDGIVSLDVKHHIDMPVCKTILSSAKVCNVGGNTLFTLIPLRSDVVNKLSIHNMFRGMETLGIVIDNNEIDLYNSYRI